MVSRLFSSLFLLGLAVAIAIGGWFLYQRLTFEEEVAGFNFSRERPLELEAAPLIRQNLSPIINAFGTIESGEQGALVFEVPGTLAELSSVALSGGNVKRGEKIASIKLDDIRDNVETQRIAVEEAEVRIEQLEKSERDIGLEVKALREQFRLDNERYEARKLLATRGFLAENALRTEEQALLNSRAQLDSSIARLNNVTNDLRLAELALDRSKISADASTADLNAVILRAPADGFIGQTALSLGQAVTSNSVIAPFTPLDGVNVSFRLGFSDYGRLLSSERINGDPSKLEGRPVTATWRLGDKVFSYEGALLSVDRNAVAGAASVRMSARLNPVTFNDPIALGAQVEVSLQAEELEDVYLVSERAISSGGEMFAISDGLLQRVAVQQLGFQGEQAIVRGEFGRAVGYAPIRTRQMYNEAKVRVTNPQDLPEVPAASDVPADDQVASTRGSDARGAESGQRGGQRARANGNAGQSAQQAQGGQSAQGGQGGQGAQGAQGRQGGQGGQGGRPNFADDPNVEMIPITEPQQRALIKGIKGSRAPDAVKQRLIAQVEKGELPAPMMERMQRFLQ